jgi:ATP-binding cassette subfamily B protein
MRALKSLFRRAVSFSVGSRKRMPYIQQTTGVDCGAACLAMVLAYHGSNVSLREIRDALGIQSDGASAAQLIRGGKPFGLTGRGYRLQTVEGLMDIPPASLLHWNLAHFVVFERMDADGAWIVDPAVGRRRVSRTELGQAFSGIVIVFDFEESFRIAARSSPSRARYAQELHRHRFDFAGILLASLFAQALSLLIPLLMSIAINVAVPKKDHELLVYLALAGLSGAAFLFVGVRIRTSFLVRLRAKVDIGMTTRFMEHLIRLPVRFFHLRTSGDLVMRLNSNSEIREIISTNTITGLLDGSVFILYMVLLLAMDSRFAGLIFLLCMFHGLVYFGQRRAQSELMAENLEIQGRAQSLEYQLISNIEMIKSAGAEQRVVQHWYKLFADYISVNLKRGRIDVVSASYREALGLMGGVIVIGYCAWQAIQGHSLLGNLMAMAAIGLGVLVPMGRLVESALQFRLLKGYFQRLDDVVEEPEEKTGSIVLSSLSGAVNMEDVSFGYSSQGAPVLRGVCLKTDPGEFIAIIGASGSGKSTLARLLSGLLLPEHGRIQYDGVDLSQLDVNRLRQQVGYVPQYPSFFDLSIENNIRLLSPEASATEIENALRQAEILEDILAMPLGLRSVLAEGGLSLSGGQRQRLALAIALARKPKLLILDEATSALDAISERRVQGHIAALQCTRIVIAHRLSTILGADRIYVIKDGRVIEEGDHEKLMQEKGCYFELVRNQLAARQQVYALS